MKVIQFAFDSREGSNYLPHTYTEHCVVYTGTHDNDTLLGWMKTAPKESVKFAKEYLNLTKEEGYNWGMMRGAWSSVGRACGGADAGSDRSWFGGTHEHAVHTGGQLAVACNIRSDYRQACQTAL